MNIGYMMACKVYGIRPLTEEEERKLSDEEKLIRQCKINLVNMCQSMRETIRKIDSYSMDVHETDGRDESKKIADIRNRMRKAVEIMDGIDETFFQKEK